MHSFRNKDQNDRYQSADVRKVQRGSARIVSLGKLVIITVLLIWIAMSIADVFWRLVPDPPLRQLEGSETTGVFVPSDAPTTRGVDAVDIDTLAQLPLFGKEESAPVVTVASPEVVREEVAETALNLELVGLFANNNQLLASAIIANGKRQELYRVNDQIAGLTNVKLVSVFADRVVLNNRGRREALYMYPDGEPISSGATISPELSPTFFSNAGRPGGTTLSSLSPGQRLEKISDVIRFSRKTKGEKMLGFRVLPGPNREAFEQTGLQLNDVVTAIDGRPLDNLGDANAIYMEKRNATQASLTVLRGEEVLTVDVDLSNITVN